MKDLQLIYREVVATYPSLNICQDSWFETEVKERGNGIYTVTYTNEDISFKATFKADTQEEFLSETKRYFRKELIKALVAESVKRVTNKMYLDLVYKAKLSPKVFEDTVKAYKEFGNKIKPVPLG